MTGGRPGVTNRGYCFAMEPQSPYPQPSGAPRLGVPLLRPSTINHLSAEVLLTEADQQSQPTRYTTRAWLRGRGRGMDWRGRMR